MLQATEYGRAAVADDGTAAYELRTYHTAEGRLPALLARFRDHTVALFARHGMSSVAYWTPTDEPLKDRTLIYILKHKSREAATESWKAFQDDPVWVKVRTESESEAQGGKIVERVESTFMVLTGFSGKV